jgi:formate hydrogenlyase subunit 3/multisubunit Na+/H+ antiporter MnhD subunit
MSTLGLLCIWLTPLLMVPFAGWRFGRWLLIFTPLPALATALLATFSVYPIDNMLEIPWLLLGTVWGLDETGRWFLLVSSVLWLTTSLYSVNRPVEELQTTRYRVFFLMAMAGNFALILAQDMISFYLGFTLMGISAYGMIKPSRTQMARHAARLYLTMTILGEVALFTAIVLLTAQTGALDFKHLQTIEFSSAAIVLLIIGFGVKIGLPGLHLWMPLTYIAAPAATVAIMSSAMLNAGLLGLLRFLPPGNESLIGWGESFVIVGLIATFYGIVIGLLQNNPRSVLAYSSISKMGTLFLGIGLMLNTPHVALLLTSAIVLYASHHAFVKSALFLGTDLYSRSNSQWIFISLCFLALALAGAPLTSGAMAKVLFKDAIPSSWHLLTQWLWVAGLTTVLLMGRFIFLIQNKHSKLSSTLSGDGIAKSAYAVLLCIIIPLPVILAPSSKLFSGTMLVVIGGVLIALFWISGPRLFRIFRIEIPPGDILVLLDQLFFPLKVKSRHLWIYMTHIMNQLNQGVTRMTQKLSDYSPSLLEVQFRRWELTGMLWLALCLGLLVILL